MLKFFSSVVKWYHAALITRSSLVRIQPLLPILFASTISYGFPENTRLGYASCTACHVSPTGGGVLTDYGVGSAAAYLPIFPVEREPRPTFANFGFDVRTMHLETRNFVMQAESHIAAFLSDQIIISGGYDYFEGPKDYYLMLKPKAYYSIRVGNFAPAYGLKIPDHRANISDGTKPQRQAIELTGYTEHGELAVTSTTDNIGLARASIFIGKSSQIGFSATSEYKFGMFAITGTERFWTLAQADWALYKKYIAFLQLGAQTIRGINVIGNMQFDYAETPEKKYQTSLQVFPVPNVELLTTVEYNKGKYFVLLMTHIFM